MLKVSEDAIAQEINVCVKPLFFFWHLHPDTNKSEHCVLDNYQDQAVGFMMQETIAKGKVILSTYWHKFQATKENLCQKYEAGQNCSVIVGNIF